MFKDSIDVVFTHGWCNDGFASKYVVWKYTNGKDIKYVDLHHGKVDREYVNSLVKDKNVLMCDFSLSYC